MKREHVNDRIQGLLGAAVAASIFSVHDTRIPLEQVKAWATSDRTRRHLLRAEVPSPEAAALVEALTPLLDRFTNRDTGHIGFAPYDVIGGLVMDVTIEHLATAMVTAAALLGTHTVVAAICAWAEGKPGTYVQTWVLRGLDVPEPLEFREGIRFERLPDGRNDLLHHMEDWYEISIRELAGQPVLRLDIAIDPMFYKPNRDEDALARNMRIRGSALKRKASRALNLSHLLDALSLVCGRSVQVVYEWNEYPEEMLLMRTSSSVGPFTHNVPSFRFHRATGSPLTPERLGQVGTVVEQMDGRGDLEVAVARWKNSGVVMDAASRIIDLRTVVECLYAQDANHELGLGLRTALCGAWHMAPTADERSAYYDKFRKLYGAASRVVHGRKPGADDGDLAQWAHDACRRAILKRLEEPSELDWTALMLGLPQPSDGDPRP